MLPARYHSKTRSWHPLLTNPGAIYASSLVGGSASPFGRAFGQRSLAWVQKPDMLTFEPCSGLFLHRREMLVNFGRSLGAGGLVVCTQREILKARSTNWKCFEPRPHRTRRPGRWGSPLAVACLGARASEHQGSLRSSPASAKVDTCSISAMGVPSLSPHTKGLVVTLLSTGCPIWSLQILLQEPMEKIRRGLESP